MKKILGSLLLIVATILVAVVCIASAVFNAIFGNPQWQQWISIDQQLNAFIGGWADETLSSRSYRLSGRSRGWRVSRSVIDAMFSYWEKDHCKLAHQSEIDRTQSPVSDRPGVNINDETRKVDQ